MSVINKVQLMGHLGQEPTIKSFSSGSKMASFSIATDEGYTNASGIKIENTQWHRIVAWGDQVTEIEKVLHKGSKVSIEGKISNRSYQDKEGKNKFLTEIVAYQFELVAKTDKAQTATQA